MRSEHASGSQRYRYVLSGFISSLPGFFLPSPRYQAHYLVDYEYLALRWSSSQTGFHGLPHLSSYA